MRRHQNAQHVVVPPTHPSIPALQLRLHEFAQEDVDVAVAAHWEPGDSAADLSRLSVEARKALRGGMLSLRVLRVGRAAAWAGHGEGGAGVWQCWAGLLGGCVAPVPLSC